jgi:hypothetical protein
MSAIAHTGELTDGKHRYQVELPDGFSLHENLAEGTLARYGDPERAIDVAIARVDYPNSPAWRDDDRFFDNVESGIRGATKRYKRIAKKRRHLGKVPTLDLWFSRQSDRARDVVATRFLFFRRYTLVLSIAMSEEAHKRHKKLAAGIIDSFEPFLP